MLNSSNRMSFIIEYISAYEEKIKLANSNGLFDNAKLFEVFAIEICKLWFNQDFSNLNDTKPNFPYLDLVSSDNRLFVQVTTSQDLPQKVKNTLENIKSSTNSFYSNVSNVYFFVLSNDSISKLKDYTGKDKIGNIDFTVKENLITTKDIIVKATSDCDFQEKLFLLLQKDFDSFEINSKKLTEAIELSKIGIESIDSKINHEYEIDRQHLIKKINEDNNKFITIQGEAGSGKSVLCKKLVEEKELVLYARAERFLEESDVNQIWHFSLINVLDYLNNKSIFFFIDALEFIADSTKSKIELLDYFYHICSQYENVKVITSCRSTDKSSFIHIEAKYSIKTYDCPLLSTQEIEEISKKYQIISQIKDTKQYASLVSSPFYVNLIVANVSDINSINDVNELRNYIWTNIICIKTKAKRYNLNSKEIIDTVNYIVLERAKKFLVGIRADELQAVVLEALKSEGVIIENNYTVRLKYDIFEDICFENHFDIQFDECRGDYNNFFSSIEKLGRCVYRRYQIWISNKLLAKPNRQKFIYALLFSNNLPDDWRIQTEIGLAKSNYSQSFFDEYIDYIVDKELLCEFIQAINLYSFNTRIVNLSNEITDILLEPSGVGRGTLIKYIYKKDLFKETNLKQRIQKLCDDFSNQKQASYEEKKYACCILEYYIDGLIYDEKQNHGRSVEIDEKICELLLPIYRLSDVSSEWINNFFNKIIAGVKDDKRSLSRTCEGIIGFTLKKAPLQLIEHMTKNICDLAEFYWTYSTQEHFAFRSHNIYGDKYYVYGLNDNAQNYEHNYRTINDCGFLFWLFKIKYFDGLKWSVEFLNKLMVNYSKQLKDDVIQITKNKQTIQYIGNENHWLVGVEEHLLPMIIGDIVYWIESELIALGEGLLQTNQERFSSVFLTIREFLYRKSNNVLFLSVIATVGMYFCRELPGYALDLATNIDVIFWDLHRYAELQDNPTRKKLEKRILLTVGLRELPKRYPTQFNKDITLRNYVFDLQFFGNDKTKEQIFQLLDYLYSITPNDDQNAKYHLQIQNMDSRIAKVQQVDESVFSVVACPTGAAAKIAQNSIEQNRRQQEFNAFISDSLEKMTSNTFNADNVFAGISKLINYTDDPIIRFSVDEYIIILVIYALKKLNLSLSQRSELCDIWITGINKILEGESFNFHYPTITILFEQLDENINPQIQNQIKLIMLKLILEYGNDGNLRDLSRYAKEYLYSNKRIANSVFYTILALLSVKEKNETDPQEAETIQKHLFNEESIDIQSIDLNNADIELICCISNCGLDLCDNAFLFVIKSLLIRMINLWASEEYAVQDLPFGASLAMESFFEKEIIRNSQAAFDCLFDNIDFSKFNHETIDFYHKVFSNLIVEFFDSHSDRKRRDNCKKAILMLENKINNITIEGVRRELYKSICLSPMFPMGDWSKCDIGYSYDDKYFINDLLSKYGKYNIESTLYTIYQLQIKHLLPEIIIPLNICFEAVRSDGFENVAKIINSPEKAIIDRVIISAFLNHNDQIKADYELCQSYEGLLETLVWGHYEKAAVILDEFRIH